ncbi:DEKNAAC102598 [Brettanomyces naardenensis]|uniref:DEKNAAC102598 n=1 Tax=Brettanomyces naardenensis TaxID=13370 RepID=A0A448YLE4_BRENA|nr:DEKNAAC102598 [Brettanomyces naardenensis]
MEHFQTRSSMKITPKVSRSQESAISSFFNESRIIQDWSIFNYEEIPGERKRLDLENEISEGVEAELEGSEEKEKDDDETEQDGDIEDSEKLDDITLNRSQLARSRANNLPELLLMGRCNVGKSSLINALLTNNRQNVKTYAKVRQRAGYTLCLNFYNIGGMFRIVDSPGYGQKGKQWQGELVFQYLQNRRVMRNCYLMLDSKVGLNQYDELIINNLVQLGVPFDVVFNKIDKIPNGHEIEHLENLIDNSILAELKIQPRYYFVNSVDTSKGIGYRSGISELRLGMIESCGLSVNRKSLRPVKRSREAEEKLKRRKLKNVKMIVNTPKD